MKEEKTKKRRILYYLVLAFSVCLLTAATVLTVYFVSNGNDDMLQNEPPVVTPPDDDEPNKPTGNELPTYCTPLSYQEVSVYNDIYTSKTTGFIYRHMGVDFAADEGTKVAAIADGTIEKISLNAKTGNVITVDHGNGLKGYYRFVEPNSTLKVGMSVEKGQYFATVASAYGSEAADGTHLHLEISVNGKLVDPASVLDIQYAEK